MATLEYRTKDDPQANGRKVEEGDVRYTFSFELENGDLLLVYTGEKGIEAFKRMLFEMQVDDMMEEVVYDPSNRQ